ncbi:MAG: NFACT family protein [Peptococcaceae bacterium]
MSLDGIAIHALADELQQRLVGGRIDKIQQPDPSTILLSIRQPGHNDKLLLSCNAQTARIGITTAAKTNPAQPPLFCMVLRKHLEGSKIIEIRQTEWERIIHIVCEGYDELGEKATRILIGEFMGKHSNLILINPQTNTILDSARRLGIEMSQYRQVLPGLAYITPPPQEKHSLFELTQEQLISFFLEAPASQSLKKILLNTIAGIGPQTAAELIYRSGLNPDDRVDFLGQYDYDRIWQQLLWLRHLLEQKAYQPTLVEDGKKAVAFAPFPLQQLEQLEQTRLDSMSQLVELFIGRKEQSNLLAQRSGDLERIINREMERCEKKLALQLDKVQEGEDAEHFKIWGELLTANLYQIKQGTEARVVDYYDPDQQLITIPMQANLTPNENAQKYFKKYAKAKAGAQQSIVQAEHTQDELNYLDSIKNSLRNAQTPDDLQDVRLELEGSGYVKARLTKQNKKNKKEPVLKPLVLHYGDIEILVGKNNVQNDYVTTRLARNNDVWFHAKDIPGSHVIIRNHQEQRELTTDVLDFAAHLAAYFSKSRYSALVPVDYTLKRHVHKPNGAKPGRVIYENQKTIYITPDEEAIQQILQQGGKSPKQQLSE